MSSRESFTISGGGDDNGMVEAMITRKSMTNFNVMGASFEIANSYDCGYFCNPPVVHVFGWTVFKLSTKGDSW